MIKKIARTLLPKIVLERFQRGKKQARNFVSLARYYGQWVTIRDWDSVDKDRKPTPWYTYPTTEFLSHLELAQFSVFEYGSGNSTLWWAARAKQVNSVEDDSDWYAKIKTKIANSFNNVSYLFELDKERYAKMAAKDFDIFIIDGKHRRECAEPVANCGRGGVMLILDNSDWYPKTVAFIQQKLGWTQIDFHGFGPINNYTWTTSVFINPERHKELTYKQPLRSQCGLVQVADSDY